MTELAEQVTSCVRIGLRHARTLVETLPLNKADGSQRTAKEFRDLVVFGIRELEKEKLV